MRRRNGAFRSEVSRKVQVTAVLVSVDRLERTCSVATEHDVSAEMEGVVLKGQTRSKRDLMETK